MWADEPFIICDSNHWFVLFVPPSLFNFPHTTTMPSPTGVAQAQAQAVAQAISDALTCGCQTGQATAQALAQAVSSAGGCGCNNYAQTIAGEGGCVLLCGASDTGRQQHVALQE
jgi:hypothetical protein